MRNKFVYERCVSLDTLSRALLCSKFVVASGNAGRATPGLVLWKMVTNTCVERLHSAQYNLTRREIMTKLSHFLGRNETRAVHYRSPFSPRVVLRKVFGGIVVVSSCCRASSFLEAMVRKSRILSFSSYTGQQSRNIYNMEISASNT